LHSTQHFLLLPQQIMTKLFLILGSLSAFTGVALGAFAAHFLKQKISPDMLAIFEVAVRYQMYHALGLFGIALLDNQFQNIQLAPIGWLFIIGTILFSGSLYALSLSGMKWFGAITPLGGLCFLAGWLWLVWRVWKY